MATSKLLKPTNVTISIPEFTDQPDQRVNSNCIDKEADAINTLSEQIGTVNSNINKKIKTVSNNVSTCLNAFTYSENGTLTIIPVEIGSSDSPTTNGVWTILQTGSGNYGWQLALQSDTDSLFFRRKFTGNWTSWKKIALIHSTNISGTTDGVGDINTGLNASLYTPIAFKITGGSIGKANPHLFLLANNGSSWWVKFINDGTLQNIANTAVEGTLYYADI